MLDNLSKSFGPHITCNIVVNKPNKMPSEILVTVDSSVEFTGLIVS